MITAVYALPMDWVAHQTSPAEADWLAQLERLPNLAHVAIIESNQAGSEGSERQGDKTASPVEVCHYSDLAGFKNLRTYAVGGFC